MSFKLALLNVLPCYRAYALFSASFCVNQKELMLLWRLIIILGKLELLTCEKGDVIGCCCVLV